MALAIRLARGGAKKRPVYRIVVADARNPRDGKYLERLGTYNPLLPKDSAERITLNNERAAHWLKVGAQPSDRVARFLDAAGLMKRTAKNNPQKGEMGDKAKERIEERAKKAADAAEAAAVAAAAPAIEEAPVVEEAPAEEVAVVEAAAEAPVAEEAPAEEVAAVEETVAEAPASAEEPAVEETPAQAATETPAEEAPAEDAEKAE